MYLGGSAVPCPGLARVKTDHWLVHGPLQVRRHLDTRSGQTWASTICSPRVLENTRAPIRIFLRFLQHTSRIPNAPGFPLLCNGPHDGTQSKTLYWVVNIAEMGKCIRVPGLPHNKYKSRIVRHPLRPRGAN